MPNEETIYIIIQVDYFALAFYNESFAKDIYDQIGSLFNSQENQINPLPNLVLLLISMELRLKSLVTTSKFPVTTT